MYCGDVSHAPDLQVICQGKTDFLAEIRRLLQAAGIASRTVPVPGG